jgi:hypothetical protein
MWISNSPFSAAFNLNVSSVSTHEGFGGIYPSNVAGVICSVVDILESLWWNNVVDPKGVEGASKISSKGISTPFSFPMDGVSGR